VGRILSEESGIFNPDFKKPPGQHPGIGRRQSAGNHSSSGFAVLPAKCTRRFANSMTKSRQVVTNPPLLHISISVIGIYVNTCLYNRLRLG
jgi:hypothetical protein